MAKQDFMRETVNSRRAFLSQASGGLGALALASLGAEASAAVTSDPLAARAHHHAPTAKSVIWCFMEGGPSHLDTFDPKPLLETYAGQPLPESYGRPLTAMPGTSHNTLMPSQRKWARHGESGLWVSDWYPHVAKHADKLAVVRSCTADGLNHVGSVCQMNTGSILAGRPAMGAWVTYGLGSANRNLPTFVILNDDVRINGGSKNWSSGFLPASYQGTLFKQEGAPILNLETPEGVGTRQQRGKLDLLGALNRHHAAKHPTETELDARLQSYELAFRMQAHAPEAVDLSKESEATKRLYGMDEEHTAIYGRNLLLARRLVERDVRFVQAYCGGWDAHTKIEQNHTKWCGVSDKPIAGLLSDLESRGLLDETLVIWGGEFGRTPFNEQGDGGTTTHGASPSGWRAAASRAGRPSVPRTSWDCARRSLPTTCMTSTPPSCTCWALTISASRTCTMAAPSVRPSTAAS